MAITQIIAIGGGKGGVGKSTVALNLALALSDGGRQVGVLDADIHGPSIPIMLGIGRTAWSRQWTVASKRRMRVIRPLERFGLKVMSFGFVLGDDQPMLLQTLGISIVVQQLANQIVWGDLDYLVVDFPPGTTDIPQILLETLDVSGALVVVTPQDVAHIDGRKAVQMYRAAKVRVIGGVENMSSFRCPNCGEALDLFPRVSHDRSIWSMGIEQFASIEVDRDIGLSGDRGLPLLRTPANSVSTQVFRDLAAKLASKLDSPTSSAT